MDVIFENLSFGYESVELFTGLSCHFGPGWTGIVGANGTGKTTILKLAAGELAPTSGNVSSPGGALYCAQRTDEMPAGLEDFFHSRDGGRLQGLLELEYDWLHRWETLSHGERKRAQIAVALWRNPRVLAVDEPTNHLDVHARNLLLAALQSFTGVGLLVSHDRELLDTLCRRCLFIEEGIMRPGTYTQGRRQAAADEETRRRQYRQVRQDCRRLEREASRRRAKAARADRQRSKGGLDRHDHDAKARIDLARVSGKDAVDGRRLRQMEGRVEQARERLHGAKVTKRYELGISIPGSASPRDRLFSLEAGELETAPGRHLILPAITMKPHDRVALTGRNGSGKSTLVRHILALPALHGLRIVYLPQEIDLGASQQILKEARELCDEELGRMMTMVSRLGSRPERLLESSTPSPGELRKLLLAKGMAARPHLIVMDEPTNHLDLASIECLEEALKDCPCALLLVSHDRRFLAALTTRRWHLTPEGPQGFRLKEE